MGYLKQQKSHYFALLPMIPLEGKKRFCMHEIRGRHESQPVLTFLSTSGNRPTSPEVIVSHLRKKALWVSGLACEDGVVAPSTPASLPCTHASPPSPPGS